MLLSLQLCRDSYLGTIFCGFLSALHDADDSEDWCEKGFTHQQAFTHMRVRRSMNKESDDATRAVLYLAGWWILISFLSVAIPQPSPMKTYHPHGPWHYAVLALGPVGAWLAAKYGGHPITFLLYGVLCTAVFDFEWASSLSWWARDSDYVPRVIGCIALPVVMGLLCRWVATIRFRLADQRARLGEYCTNCEYNLTGNVSGICSECGVAIPTDRGLAVMTESDHIVAHKRSVFHRDEITASEQCGCFYCLKVFAPEAIEEWRDNDDSRGDTALCPHCGIDSVIGSQSGYPITAAFLGKMRDHWFR